MSEVLPFEDTPRPVGEKAALETPVLVKCRGCDNYYQTWWLNAASDARLGRRRWGHHECLAEDAAAGDPEAIELVMLAEERWRKRDAQG